MRRSMGFLLVIIALLPVPPCMGADTPPLAVSAQRPPALPSDPAVAAAVQEIAGKLKALQSYSCKITGLSHMELKDGPHDSETKLEEAYKRPCRFKIRVTTVKDPMVGNEGAVQDVVVDGQTWLNSRQNAPGSGQKMLDAARNKPLMSAEEFIRRHEAPVTTTKDLEAWFAKGHSEEDLAREVPSRILAPFGKCDMSALTIESEDNTQWVFSARLPQTKGSVYQFMRVTIGKADGILRESQFGRDDGKWNCIERVDSIELNPDLPDSLFTFTLVADADKK